MAPLSHVRLKKMEGKLISKYEHGSPLKSLFNNLIKTILRPSPYVL